MTGLKNKATVSEQNTKEAYQTPEREREEEMRRTLIKQVGVRDGSTTMEGCRGGAAKEDGRDLELQATVANGGVRGRKMEAEGT